MREPPFPEKVVIACALTGAQQGKEANPNLPEQPGEIIEQAVACAGAGASVVHIHARDARGKATADVETFRKIVRGIRERSDVVLNLTTGGAVAGIPLEERLRVVSEFRPEVASFSVGSGSLLGRVDGGRFTRDQFVSLVPSYAEMVKTCEIFRGHGVKPELEVYGTGFLNNVWTLKELGVLEDPLLVNIVTNIPGETLPWTPKNVMFMVDSLPPNANWVVSAIGAKVHFRSVALAAALGGHVRVGMEDNVYISRGRLAESNARLVEKAARICREVGREPATPDEAREILGLRRAS